MQKKLIIFIVALFILSSAYLLSVGSKFETLNFGKNWWSIYFVSPKDNSLNFVIENHSGKTNFHYVILIDKERIKEADENIRKDGLLEFSSRNFQELNSRNLENKKITIEVSTGDEKKEIYKNF
ncbi:MAG: hypothetical protein WCV59_01015 [Parcubacteria group bacterium]|jgi:hypothetical protein